MGESNGNSMLRQKGNDRKASRPRNIPYKDPGVQPCVVVQHGQALGREGEGKVEECL